MSEEPTTPTVHDRMQERLTLVLSQSPLREQDALSVLQEMSNTVEELRVADEEVRVQAEQLEASAEVIDAERARYAELFAFAPDAYVETDHLGKISEANRAAEALLGVPLRQLVGTLLVTFVAAGERRRFRRLLADPEPTSDERIFTLRRRRGDSVAVGVVCGSALGDRDPPVRRVRWLLRDVTERLDLEGRVVDLLAEVELLSSIDRLELFTDDVDPFASSLTSILVIAERVVPQGAVGVHLADGPDATEGVVRSEVASVLDDAQHQAGAGPGVEATETGRLVRGDPSRWPALVRPVEACGVVEMIGLPMAGETVRGALNVYVGSEPLDDQVLRLLTLLAEQASGVLSAAGLLRASSELVENLHRAMKSRSVIDQAKGLLMARHGCDAVAAFAMLRTASQRENVKLREIADLIMTGAVEVERA